MVKFLNFIFNISVFFLIIISIYPGSLIGFLFYGDLEKQPDLISNPFGTSINHFIYYLYVSLLGFITYLRSKKFQKLAYVLLFLSLILEFFHLIIPNRSFQLDDLIANFLGVTVAYFSVKIYLLFK